MFVLSGVFLSTRQILRDRPQGRKVAVQGRVFVGPLGGLDRPSRTEIPPFLSPQALYWNSILRSFICSPADQAAHHPRNRFTAYRFIFM